MITITQLLQTVCLNEGAEEAATTGHMTHIGDWSIYGNPEEALNHAEATHKFLNGTTTPNHSVSLKADGGVSVVVGKKHDGRHFISYKSGKNLFHTPEEIDAAGVPWADDGKKILKHITEMNIKPGHAFQGDVMWGDRNTDIKDGVVQPNTIKYTPTQHSMGIAVHSQYHIDENSKFHRVSNAPDISQLSHPHVFVPDLQLKPGQIPLTAERNKSVTHALSKAKKALSPDVQSYAKQVSTTPNVHKFLQEYLNEVVATTGHRSVSSLREYIHRPIYGGNTSYGYMEKATQRNKSDKSKTALVSELEQHINNNEKHITGLFTHMTHLATAKHAMLDQIHEHVKQMSLVPHGSESHEGIVSAFGTPDESGILRNVSLAKLTAEGINGFSARNRRRGLEKGFAKPRETAHPDVPFIDHTEKPLKEEMSVGAGGIAGIGGPEDVAVPKDAQKKYTSRKRSIWKRKISESFFKKI